MDKPKQALVEEWMKVTTGPVHYTNACDSQFGRENWPHLRVIFYRMVEKGIAEAVRGRDGYYRYIKKELDKFEWWKADPEAVVDLGWPYSPDDETDFELHKIKIYPNSIIVISGASNWGKTCFCLNFVMENMDKHRVYYWTNELGEEEFADRIRHFANRYEYITDDGSPKFQVKPCFENWQDVIVPDGVNVIDYLDPGNEPYIIGVVIDKLRQKLSGGIVLLAIQKKVLKYTDKKGDKHYSYSDYGTGGQYSEHRARLVIHLDPMEDGDCRLLIKKAKGYLTGKKFATKIVNHGSQFHNIRELEED